jgi:hypothetical protein
VRVDCSPPLNHTKCGRATKPGQAHGLLELANVKGTLKDAEGKSIHFEAHIYFSPPAG